MRNLFSRPAFFVTVGYAILLASILIYTWRVSGGEDWIWGFLILGFPWSLVTFALSSVRWAASFELLLSILAIGLDIITVYVFLFFIIKFVVRGRQSG